VKAAWFDLKLESAYCNASLADGDEPLEDSSPLRDGLGGSIGYDALKNIYDVVRKPSPISK